MWHPLVDIVDPWQRYTDTWNIDQLYFCVYPIPVALPFHKSSWVCSDQSRTKIPRDWRDRGTSIPCAKTRHLAPSRHLVLFVSWVINIDLSSFGTGIKSSNNNNSVRWWILPPKIMYRCIQPLLFPCTRTVKEFLTKLPIPRQASCCLDGVIIVGSQKAQQGSFLENELWYYFLGRHVLALVLGFDRLQRFGEASRRRTTWLWGCWVPFVRSFASPFASRCLSCSLCILEYVPVFISSKTSSIFRPFNLLSSSPSSSSTKEEEEEGL